MSGSLRKVDFPMAGKKRTAVVGCGWFGRAHVRNFVAASELVAVCDADKKVAEDVAKQNNARAYTDVKSMLDAEKIDAVSIVTPPQVIPGIGLECAKKGCDLLIEKPCGLKLADLDSLFAYKDSIRIMPGFLEIFNPVMDDVLREIKTIGEIMTVDSTRIGLFPKRNWPVGVMMDLGVHDVYLHREIAKAATGDANVVEVSSVLKYLSPASKFEDAIFVLLRFNKMVTCINANWITPSKYRKLRVAGTDATLEADFISGVTRKIWGEDLKGPTARTIEHVITPFVREEPLAREIKTFLYETSIPVNLQDAHDVLKIVLQALHQI
ncbi:MAG: Gfo/Idh/MocA family protein [Candidatus Sigynarchaeota archaeon]